MLPRLAPLAAAVLGVGAPAVAQSPSPSFPGEAFVAGAAADAGRNAQRDRGLFLFGELGCASCHDPGAAAAAHLWPRTAPDLRGVGGRMTSQALRAFLSSPSTAKPGTAMPHLARDADDVDALVHYLVDRGGPIAASDVGATPADAARGERTWKRSGCVACHPVGAGSDGDGVPLGDLARKTTVEQLEAFLLDPHATRPGGRMPDFRLEPKDARALAIYLLRKQLENPRTANADDVSVPGLRFRYWEKGGMRQLPDIGDEPPKLEGFVATVTHDIPDRPRDNNFLIHLDGLIDVPESGAWTLVLRSDDGSRLLVDGEVVIENDGTHPETDADVIVQLDRGKHSIHVEMFESGGGEHLSMRWGRDGAEPTAVPAAALSFRRGRPMIPLDAKPFALDDARRTRGAERFRSLGCVSCHATLAADDDDGGARAKPLAALSADAAGGCLSASPRAGVPQWSLTDAQRTALTAILTDRSWAATAPTPAERAARGLAAHGCVACHERGAHGGVAGDRVDLFESKVEIDLGDEGVLPPPLGDVGAKLRDDALRRIVTKGELHVRSRFMHARMPSYPAELVDGLLDSVVAADRQPGDLDAPAFTAQAVEDGKRIVGVTGLSCVTCHWVNGAEAVAIPGIDLATSHERLTPGWFRRFLSTPGTTKPNTRMPGFWLGGAVPFPDLGGGTADGQIDAVWTYLSLAKSMPLPVGVSVDSSAGAELVPQGDEAVVHRTFMAGVGPRAIVVGYPEAAHVAFDANHVRLAKAWRGRFFDASGVASGRTDTFNGPLGDDVVDFPAGPAFAVLADDAAAWPVLGEKERVVGRFRGYRLDAKRRPTFGWEQDGVAIEETPVPVYGPGGTNLIRRFRIEPGPAARALTFRAWTATTIETTDDQATNTWRTDDGVTITLKLPATARAFVRTVDGTAELLVTLPASGTTKLELEEEIRW